MTLPRRASGVLLVGLLLSSPVVAAPEPAEHEWLPADPRVLLPFAEERPIRFVVGGAEWDRLPAFWNAGAEETTDPKTGARVVRSVVRIKVPLGLPLPPEQTDNPLTFSRWSLGKDLFFDPVLSADNTISCANCHNPGTGFTTPTRLSTGIGGRLGARNAPTLLNVAYNRSFFWDGRASSLEEQAQAPVQDTSEMHDGFGNAWLRVVTRVRAKGAYRARFLAAFGTEPTRDSIAKALAGYERTLLSGNSIHDRAVRRARDRGAAEAVPLARDYAAVLEELIRRNDTSLLSALQGKDVSEAPITSRDVKFFAKSLAEGRRLFFNLGGCQECHRGERFTDDAFHNMGVGVEDGKLPRGGEGRFAALPVGRKDETMRGAFKTPSLRNLVYTGPYLHDGSRDSLEAVVDFYATNDGVNEFLDARRRDLESERELHRALEAGNGTLPDQFLFGVGKKLVLPLRRPLRGEPNLVLFLRALEGEAVDPLVADPKQIPK